MEEKLLNERKENLESCVLAALVKMKTDDLAKQLEFHKESTNFIPERMNEVLTINMDNERESYIKKLLRDIEESEAIKEKIKFKLSKSALKQKLKNKELASDRFALIQRKSDLQKKSKHINSEFSNLGKHYDRMEKDIENRIEVVSCSFSSTKNIISSLFNELTTLKSEAKECFETNAKGNKMLHQKVSKQVIQSAFNDMTINSSQNDYDILKRIDLLKEIRSNNLIMKNSVYQVSEFVSNITSQRVEQNSYSNMKQVLFAHCISKEKEHIDSFLKKSGTHLTHANFLHETKNAYHKALLKKEQEYEVIIRNAKLRHNKLEIELTRALKQLQDLIDFHSSDDNDIIYELQRTHKDFESTTQMLNHTMNLLSIQSNSSTKEKTMLVSTQN